MKKRLFLFAISIIFWGLLSGQNILRIYKSDKTTVEFPINSLDSITITSSTKPPKPESGIEALYISFGKVNPYQLPPTGLETTMNKTVEASKPENPVKTFSFRVWHLVYPEDKYPYIDYTITQTGDPVIEMVSENRDNKSFTSFEYRVGNTSGTAVINFRVYNWQGELGDQFAPYLYQDITARITVINKNEFFVESVKFYPEEEMHTSAKNACMNIEVLPLSISAIWPPVLTIESLQNGAEAIINNNCLSITHAGIIKVKATAGGADKEKSDVCTVTAKFKLYMNNPKPIEISNVPKILPVGETYRINTIMHANYMLNEDEYLWESSDPSVISVDGSGNIRTLKEGKSEITVTVKDDFGNYASDKHSITIKNTSMNVNFNDPEFADYYVIESHNSTFFIDTREGAISYYTFYLNRSLSDNGTYTAGADFTGTIQFPEEEGGEYNISSGAITINNGNMTMDLTITGNVITGRITGTRPIL